MDEHVKDSNEASDSTAGAKSADKSGTLPPTQAQIEEAYHAFIDHSSQGLMIFQDGRAVFANRAMVDITGYSLDEILSMSAERIRDFVHPEDRELVWARHRKRLAGDSIEERYEIRGIRKDGGICWLEIHASRIEYDGRPAVQAAYVDISTRRQAEEARRQSERKYRTLVEGAPSFILVVRDGKFIYANPASARHLGFEDPSMLVGIDVLAVVDPSCHGQIRERMRRVADGGENPPMELKLLACDGATRWVESVSLPIALDGEPAVLVISQDITKRREAEQELDRAHQFLLTALDSFPGSVVVLDGTGGIVMANDSWMAFGHANGPAPGSFDAGVNYLDACRLAAGPGGKEARETGGALAAVLSGERDDFHVDYPCHDAGRNRWFHLKARGFSSGDKRWAVLTHTDITERRRGEERLLRYQERLRSLAAKLAFAREREKRRVGLGLNDQIGQSLVMIKLSLQTLQETVNREAAQTLAHACSGIDSVVEQIRLLSLDLTNSVLHEVGFREAVEAHLEQEIQKKHGIACECQASGDFSGLDVEMKMALFCNIRELLAHIVNHAHAGHVHMRLEQNDGFITIAIEDDGDGPEWKKLSAPCDSDSGDSGLFGIREQVEVLGGTVSISAGTGHGTCITIVAPVQCRIDLRPQVVHVVHDIT